YSDAAVLQDAWTRAWMVIDISPTGEVTRLKFVKRPGYDLDAIAISEAFKLRFKPARDDSGAPIETWLVWGIEWPASTYLIARGLTLSALPPMVGLPSRPGSHGVPCRGSGPWNMSSKLWIGYRDCSLPDLSRMLSERWIARPPM
ncbi:MAG: energy transducer TonB, partial [bacterium]